jgi:hypothetical protein
MDRILRSVVSRAMRRGMNGDPVWLAAGVALWLVSRARRSGPDVVWKCRVKPGERLIISASDATTPGVAGPVA